MGKRSTLFIPQDGDDFSAEWFTECLQPEYGAAVLEVNREVIGTGIGFVGEVYRCFLTWDAIREDLPASVIVKVPSKIPANRGLGEGLQLYEREIIAYRELSNGMGIPIPKVYYTAMDDDPTPWLDAVIEFLFTHLPPKGVNWLAVKFLELAGKSPALRRYLLVLEDIHDARPPSQVAGGSLDDASLALTALAKFHATHWLQDASVNISPRVWPLDRLPKVWRASYLRNRNEFVERFGNLIGDEKLKILDQAQEEIPALLKPLGEPPWTLLHGDYRLDNIMFRPDGSIVVIDFQILSKGRPGWDVAYFITTALTPEHKSEEEALLRHYHNVLCSAGVEDYPFSLLLEDVRLTKLLLAHRLVGGRDAFDTELQDTDETFVDVLVKRVVGWI
ncbi:MAG: phosphotransferase [Acidimicrobiales bacterium]|jgi:serine/threonine protein kinase|nr:phosphotransferase [Acidimicrobiales bacterium]MDP6322760.1 phosphotransferase [Acidimicrobiales bacterium]HJM27989.1 phosphotransferase [Acidimicrobiales bacterium]HJM97366.1 phosphotransferase [Acidimicrobiales bacterium]